MEQNSQVTNDFSGGITDYIFDADPSQNAALNNVIIDVNKKPYTRDGFESIDIENPQLPSGNSPCQALIPFNSVLYAVNAENIYYYTSSWQTLSGVGSNKALPSNTTSGFISTAIWRNHLLITDDLQVRRPMKVFVDGSSVTKCRSAGLPAFTGASISAGTGTGSNWLYALTYYYTYTVGTLTFTDESTPQIIDAADNKGSFIITFPAALTNTANTNYEISSIQIRLYRTVSNGSDFYLVTTQALGAVPYTDSATDAALILLTPAYFNGGILDNDEPPISKYVHVVNGKAYYANCKLGSAVYSTRIYESKQDDIDSVPLTSYVDVEYPIIGISSFSGRVIVFTETKVYRLDGTYNDLGQGSISWEEIDMAVGCVSHNSIIQNREGVFWASKNGIYMTDAYKVQRISESLNRSFETLFNTSTKRSKCHATYDPLNNRILWGVYIDSTSTNNDGFLVVDLKHGIRQNSCFTSWSNPSYMFPYSACILDSVFYHGDYRGYVLKWTPDLTADLRIDTTTSASTWGTKAIVYSILSCAYNFGLEQIRKWATNFKITLENITNASVQINSINDDSGISKALKPIRYRGNLTWGIDSFIWGVDDLIWGFSGIIEQKRRFVAGDLRFSYKQIQITNAYTNIFNSDDYTTVTVDNVSKIATLTNIVDYAFQLDMLDYYISFENDGYIIDYSLLTVTTSTLTFVDSGNTAPSGTQKWVIRGIPKGEQIGVLSYVIDFSPISKTQRPYQATSEDTGANT